MNIRIEKAEVTEAGITLTGSYPDQRRGQAPYSACRDIQEYTYHHQVTPHVPREVCEAAFQAWKIWGEPYGNT